MLKTLQHYWNRSRTYQLAHLQAEFDHVSVLIISLTDRRDLVISLTDRRDRIQKHIDALSKEDAGEQK